jgi:hypothetical protein
MAWEVNSVKKLDWPFAARGYRLVSGVSQQTSLLRPQWFICIFHFIAVFGEDFLFVFKDLLLSGVGFLKVLTLRGTCLLECNATKSCRSALMEEHTAPSRSRRHANILLIVSCLPLAVNFWWSVRRHIPEQNILRLTSYILFTLCLWFFVLYMFSGNFVVYTAKYFSRYNCNRTILCGFNIYNLETDKYSVRRM